LAADIPAPRLLARLISELSELLLEEAMRTYSVEASHLRAGFWCVNATYDTHPSTILVDEICSFEDARLTALMLAAESGVVSLHAAPLTMTEFSSEEQVHRLNRTCRFGGVDTYE